MYFTILNQPAIKLFRCGTFTPRPKCTRGQHGCQVKLCNISLCNKLVVKTLTQCHFDYCLYFNRNIKFDSKFDFDFDV